MFMKNIPLRRNRYQPKTEELHDTFYAERNPSDQSFQSKTLPVFRCVVFREGYRITLTTPELPMQNRSPGMTSLYKPFLRQHVTVEKYWYKQMVSRYQPPISSISERRFHVSS